MNVVPMPPPTDATPTLIAMLEAALVRARGGDLESFIMIATVRGGGMVSARHSPDGVDRYALIGAVVYETHQLNQLMDASGARVVHFLPPE